jgi:branched-chain amino acid transport system permease protein
MKRSHSIRKAYLAGLLVVCAFIVYPLVVDPEESYMVYFLFMCFLYVTLAQGWNLVAGYAGQASFGQHAFFGIGAYITAIAWKAEWTGYLDPMGMLMSGAGAALLAAIIGIALLAKLRGDYFALGTLGLGEILRVVITQGGTLTGGPVGLLLPSSAYQSLRPYYYIALFIALAALFSVWFLVKSRVGLALVAIREDEEAAAANGIHVLKFKILAFAAGALFTGLCGSIYAYYLFQIHPLGFFSLNWALLPVLMTVLGGIGTIMGPILGAFILTGVFELTNLYIPEIHPIFSGAFIILVMLFLPQGVISLGRKGEKHQALKNLVPFKWISSPFAKERR